MILRRLIEHFRKQEWTAIAIDFVIVVAGVFVGLQVSNWNAARADALDYAGALGRLRAEIDANMKTLDLADADVAAELPVARRAYEALETCSDDLETQRAVNDGLAIIVGSNGLQLRNSELVALTSEPRLLAQQSPAVRRGLSDLRYAEELIVRLARDFEDRPLTAYPERIEGIRPGPRKAQSYTYLGLTMTTERRQLELAEPVSAACDNQDLIGALWAYDRAQSNLPDITKKMRADYKAALELLDAEARR